MSNENSFNKMRDIIQQEMKAQNRSADDVRASLKDDLESLKARAEKRNSGNTDSKYATPYDTYLGNAQVDAIMEKEEDE